MINIIKFNNSKRYITKLLIIKLAMLFSTINISVVLYLNLKLFYLLFENGTFYSSFFILRPRLVRLFQRLHEPFGAVWSRFVPNGVK